MEGRWLDGWKMDEWMDRWVEDRKMMDSKKMEGWIKDG